MSRFATFTEARTFLGFQSWRNEILPQVSFVLELWRALVDGTLGEELFISYVDPDLPVSARQHKLREWSFRCECERCTEEGLRGGESEGGELGSPADLEKELKAGLGLF